MRNLKKILSLALAVVMVLSMMVTASAAFADQDQINAKYAEAVDVMAELEILLGSNGNFDPKGNLTRAQAAKILSVINSGETDASYFADEAAYVENPFEDVKGWAVDYVLYCYQYGIVAGRNATTFDPNGNVTGYEFAKMLLVAAGVAAGEDFIGDANKTWQQKTVELAKNAELLKGMTITLSANITREQASQMALNAMKYGGETTVTYDVVETATKTVIANYADILPAHQLRAALGAGYEVKPNVQSSGSLLADVWEVTYTKGGADENGRTADVYTFTDAKGNPYNKYFNTASALKTYTKAVTAAEIQAEWKDYTFKGVEIFVDNGTYTVKGDTTYAVIANYSGNNTVVEVYANKKAVEKIVVLTTKFDYAKVTPAQGTTPELVTIGGITVANAYGLKNGEAVAYTTVANGTELASVEKLNGVEGTLATYTTNGYYVVNGGTYTLANTGVKSLIEGTLKTGAKLVYYFGANNTIVLAHAPNVTPVTPEDVVYNNFAKVLKTVVKKVGETIVPGNIWQNDGIVNNYVAAAQLLLATGELAEVAVEVKYTTSDIKDAQGNVLMAKYNYYYVIDGQYFTVNPANPALSALPAGKIVAYENGAIKFPVDVTAQTAKKADGNAYTVTADTIQNNTPALNGYIIVNSDTVFVYETKDAQGNTVYKTIKGQTSLNKVSSLTGGDVIVAVDYTAANAALQLPESWSYVAKVVFVTSADLKDVTVTPEAQDYLYVNTLAYSVSYDAVKKAEVYSYVAFKTDGTQTVVNQYAPLGASGIYTVMSNGSLVPVTTAHAAVIGVNGTTLTVTPDGVNYGFVVTNDKTVVAGSIMVGVGVAYADINADGIVDLIWTYTL